MKVFLWMIVSTIFVSPAYSQTIKAEGVYEVPTHDPLLKPYASLKLLDASLTFLNEEKTKAIVRYVLPLELTGRRISVVMKGEKDPLSNLIHFKGPKGSSTCAAGWGNLQCTIAFRKEALAIDIEQVKAFLTTKYLQGRRSLDGLNEPTHDLPAIEDPFTFSPEEVDFNHSVGVAEQFMGEAIGFIRALPESSQTRASALSLAEGERTWVKSPFEGGNWFRISGQGKLQVEMAGLSDDAKVKITDRFGRKVEGFENPHYGRVVFPVESKGDYTLYVEVLSSSAFSLEVLDAD